MTATAAGTPAAPPGLSTGEDTRATTPRPGVEITARSPPEHRLGEQSAELALEMAELLGGMPAVTAHQQMLLHIGQQGAATSDRDVEETAVQAAFLGRREFAVGVYTGGAELLASLLQRRRSAHGVHPQKSGRYGKGLGLDLGVPEQALGRSRQDAE